CPSHTHTAYLRKTLDLLDVFLHMRYRGFWSTIKQRVDRFPCQPHADPDNNAGDAQGCHCIGLCQPGWKLESLCEAYHQQASNNDRGTPDIRAEVECIGLQRLTPQSTGNPQ